MVNFGTSKKSTASMGEIYRGRLDPWLPIEKNLNEMLQTVGTIQWTCYTQTQSMKYMYMFLAISDLCLSFNLRPIFKRTLRATAFAKIFYKYNYTAVHGIPQTWKYPLQLWYPHQKVLDLLSRLCTEVASPIMAGIFLICNPPLQAVPDALL